MCFVKGRESGMNRKTLARCLKGIVCFLILVGVAVYAGMVPDLIRDAARRFPEFAHLATPMIVLISLTALPVALALYELWNICTRIARDRSFCRENARGMAVIGVCALTDTVYCFGIAVFLSLKGASNPGVLVMMLGVIVVGLLIAVAAFLISHLVEKASAMEEELELTV